ncbi:MAG: PBP1A family penicillin-binding protein [Deltaproteobacteria bacterium]|nr:PBP1A family penicillin-binding protein [Deltaproteobacteria bacterium]
MSETPATTPPPPPQPEPVPGGHNGHSNGHALPLVVLGLPPEPTRAGRWVRLGAYLLVMGLVSATAVSVLGYALFSKDLPNFRSVAEYRPRLVTRAYSSDHRLIGEFALERRILVPYEKIPRRLIQAFVASEDGKFFEHGGVDYLGMLRSVLVAARTGRATQGASTITMQLAKSLLVAQEGYKKGTERSARRKVRQILLARRLEQTLTKEDILYLYLNEIYLGHGAYGVEAAAQNYFRKSVNELNLAEMTLIAGLPAAPSTYSPFVHPDKARARQKYVLGRMVEEGFITQKELDDALALTVEQTTHPRDDRFKDTAPYFTEHVRRYVLDNYGEKALLAGGLVVETTLDLERQLYAEEAMQKALKDLDKRQGYRGPLMHVDTPEARAEVSERYAQKVLHGAPLVKGQTYVAVVEKLRERNVATVRIGEHAAHLPLGFMRWARKPNHETWWESQLVKKQADVLSVGDVILVRVAALEEMKKVDFTRENLVELEPELTEDGTAFRDGKPVVALDQEPVVQGAMVSMDPATGYVQAMIGGYNFEESEYNRAFQACRQPGSAFKPIIYAGAVDLEDFTPSTILVDSPLILDDTDAKKRWKPQNFEEEFKGDVTVRTAVMNSMNVPAIKTMQQVGLERAVAYAQRLGVKTPLKKELGTAIGSSCVTLWELMAVYTVFNRLGLRGEPLFIKRITDRDGNVLEENADPNDGWQSREQRLLAMQTALDRAPERVMEAPDAFIVQYLLTQVAKFGTAARASQIGRLVAGKTGTTNDSFDAWFMGYTPTLVTGVWVGYDQNVNPLGAREQGGRTALPAWMEYTKRALNGIEEPGWTVPENICLFHVHKETGKRVPADDRNEVQVPFVCGSEPKLEDAVPTQAEGFRDDGL